MNINGRISLFSGCRKLVASSLGLSCQHGAQSGRVLAVLPSRSLYTKEALGIQGYQNAREKTSTQLGTMKDRFKTRMNEYLSGDSKSLIFTEDLKNMLYLAESDADLEMINKMMKKYAKQNEQMRFGSFVFGPVLMRMYYHLNKPDEALKAVQDAESAGLFDQLTSYQLMMDLLYEHKRYDDVVSLFDAMTKRPVFSGRFPKDCLVLAVAACYKLGTKDSYKRALEIIKTAVDANAPVMRKAVAFAAALALKNDDATGALELLAIPSNQSYVTIRNLKALALLKLDRLEDVLPLLRSVIEQDISYQKRAIPNYFPEVLAEIKKALEKKDDTELQQEFDKVFKSLEQGQHIDAGNLDEFLERPIEDHLRTPPGQQGSEGTGYRTRDSQFRYQPQTYGNRGGDTQDQSFPRQPRYRDDFNQGGERPQRTGGFNRDRSTEGGGYMGRNRQPGMSEFPRQQRSYGRRDDEGGEQTGKFGRDRSDDPNVQAGYKPQGSFRQRAMGGRQGLRDLDD